jgi:hypothetical protein
MAKRKLYLPVMIAAALAVLALTLVVAPAAMAQTASVEGESFTHPRGTAVVHDQMYSGGAALKFNKSKAVATKQVTISEPSTVLVRARADQKKGDSPTLDIRVDGENSGTRRITSSALADYNYPAVTLQPGTYTIGLKGGNIAQGRNVFVDVVSFPGVEVEEPPEPVVDIDNSTSAEYNRYFFRNGYADEDSADRYPALVQTFTPGKSGTLVGIDLWLSKEQVSDTGATISILSASDPPDSLAPVLGQIRFDIPDSWATGSLDGPFNLAEVRFPDGVPVQAGTQYAIQLAMDGPEMLGIAQTTSEDYPGGRMWSYYPGGPNGNPISSAYGADLRFKTFVVE